MLVGERWIEFWVLILTASVSLVACQGIFLSVCLRKGNPLWLVLGPLQPFSARIRRGITKVESEQSIMTRLTANVCVAYSILAVAVLLFALALFVVDDLCVPAGSALALGTFTSVALHGVATPRLHYVIVCKHATVRAVNRELRWWCLAAFLPAGIAVIAYNMERSASGALDPARVGGKRSSCQRRFRPSLFAQWELAIVIFVAASVLYALGIGRAISAELGKSARAATPPPLGGENACPLDAGRAADVALRRAMLEDAAADSFDAADAVDGGDAEAEGSEAADAAADGSDAVIFADVSLRSRRPVPRNLNPSAIILRRLRYSSLVYVVQWSLVLVLHLVDMVVRGLSNGHKPIRPPRAQDDFFGVAQTQVFGAALVATAGALYAAVAYASDAQLHDVSKKIARLLDRVLPNVGYQTVTRRLGLCGGEPCDAAVEARPRRRSSVADAAGRVVTTDLFITTLNCAELASTRALFIDADFAGHASKRDVDVDTALRKWLPRGKDVYVVGVQECMCWDELRAAVLRSLNEAGPAAPSGAYVCVARTAIGKRVVKGHIGVAVFARETDVDSGFVAVGDERGSRRSDDAASAPRAAAHVALGRNLGAGRMTNKGCTGVRVRIGGDHLVFLVAHLPADAAGRARRMRRNACAAASLLKAGLQLGAADVGDAAAQHLVAAATHTFFLGDLNYRCNAPSFEHARDGLLKLVAQALKAKPGTEDAARCWRRATLHDELAREHEKGRVLSTFRELPLCFAPTFRRKIGAAGTFDASRPATAATLAASYTLFKDEGGGANDDAVEITPADRAPRPFRRAGRDAADDETQYAAALQRARERLQAEERRPLGKGHASASAPERQWDAVAAAAAHAGLRAPSWTDRILVHSLPNAADELVLEEYTSCEATSVSDHRPVTLRCQLRQPARRARLVEAATRRRATDAARAEAADKDAFTRLLVTLEDLSVDDLKAAGPSLDWLDDEERDSEPEPGRAPPTPPGSLREIGVRTPEAVRAAAGGARSLSLRDDDDEDGLELRPRPRADSESALPTAPPWAKRSSSVSSLNSEGDVASVDDGDDGGDTAAAPKAAARPSSSRRLSVRQLVTQRGSNVAIDRVSLYFPLPVEDAFRSRRQLDSSIALLQGAGAAADAETDYEARQRLLRSARHAPWARRRVAARADDVHRSLARHALVGVETEAPYVDPPKRFAAAKKAGGRSDKEPAAKYKTIAYAVVPLPCAGTPAREPFRVPLTHAGYVLGYLQGTVAVSDLQADGGPEGPEYKPQPRIPRGPPTLATPLLARCSSGGSGGSSTPAPRDDASRSRSSSSIGSCAPREDGAAWASPAAVEPGGAVEAGRDSAHSPASPTNFSIEIEN